ncbi:integrase core domain-containing protein [Synechococcus sp. CCAP 1479/9]|uniref:integrase core domain-containing protein n=1 Tax=Synechococcus sp. CCAP 1479/9 TaxID=1221593 RepID=UPI00336A2CE3
MLVYRHGLCGQPTGREDQDQLCCQNALPRNHPEGEVVAHSQVRGDLLIRYSDGWEAEFSQARFFRSYGHVRPHSALGDQTPNEVYTGTKICPSRPGITMTRIRSVQ